MHYYQHHIGDFIKDTANLDDHQLATYLRMIWAYYATETALIDDVESIAFAMRSDEKTVRLLLRHFFYLEEGFWRHKRCDAEIEKYHSKSEKAATAAKKRWKNAEKKKQGLAPKDAKTMRTQCDRNASASENNADEPFFDANQEPITNNISTSVDIYTPPKKKAPVIPDWIPRDAWLGFVEMRKAKKKPLTERAIHGIEKKLIAFMNQGFDIAAILDQSTINGWTDVYAPKDNTGAHYANNQRLTPAQQRTAESQRIDELLRSGAAGILGHSNKDIRPPQDCAPVPVSARLSDSGISDVGCEIVGEYFPSGTD